MKYSFVFSVFGLSCLAMAYLNANSGGAPSGRSGSPASNNQTCASAGCHSAGNSTADGKVSINTNIPSTGFVVGASYEITISAIDSASFASVIGFCASAENGNGSHAGILTGGADVQNTFGNASYVTHRSNSNSLPASGRSYTFSWQAPTTNVPNEVVFYAAVNFCNGNGTTSGDRVVTATTSALANTIGLNEVKNFNPSISPNPSKGYSRLVWGNISGQFMAFEVVDAQGRVVYEGRNFGESESLLPDLSKGIYTINWKVENGKNNGHIRWICQ